MDGGSIRLYPPQSWLANCSERARLRFGAVSAEVQARKAPPKRVQLLHTRGLMTGTPRDLEPQ